MYNEQQMMLLYLNQRVHNQISESVQESLNAHCGRSVDMQKILLTRLPPLARIMVKIRTLGADNLELDSTICNCNCTLYFERKTKKNIVDNFKVTFNDSLRVFFCANSGSVSLFFSFLRSLELLSEGFNKKTLNITSQLRLLLCAVLAHRVTSLTVLVACVGAFVLD